MKKIQWILGCFILMFCSIANAGGQAPDFSFRDIDGKQHRLSDYRGKWVIVNYWSMECSHLLTGDSGAQGDCTTLS